RMLFHNVVHADLSPFNLLVWEDRVRVIDLPQAVDPRFNPNAWDLLARDLRNVCTWFAGHGVDTDAETLAADLRTGFEFAELVPPDLDF
ncbi:MAG: RIO1 family regulatory kinase/ATPase, partial [Actinomycetota bacterium]